MCPVSSETTIFEKAVPGRVGMRLPSSGVPLTHWRGGLPRGMRRETVLPLPALTEPEVIRHFTRLSRKNFAIDAGFYPLGSCTMKYNPKLNELMSRLPGFAGLHPYQPTETAQGALTVMAELEQALQALTGMARVTLQPAAGAHGELTGILMIKAYHQDRSDDARTEIIVPDSAHGTNPATAALAGYTVITVPSDGRGQVDMEALRGVVGPRTAGMMLTNPNTLGLFEENIAEITGLIHQAGGLMYYDGANFNAIMGLVRPGDMGFDVVHLNLHKTMTTPHGGGGPGSGPVGVSKILEPYLPTPLVQNRDGVYYFDFDRPKSIGRVKAYYGNFGMHVRALSYILTMGGDGLRQASEDAVLNANYLRVKLQSHFRLPFEQVCMHEFVLSGDRQKKAGANTLAIGKRLIDYGYHPPTIYFPLVVPEALMIEPTETESRATLDAFAAAMTAIAKEVESDASLVTGAPYSAPVGRVDEAQAARKPNFRWALPQEGTVEAAAVAARPAGCA
ncbi:MAG: aminomethyl-transferring glycine dehydrogenase subunit GcvPB [Candidatus Sericytochromatia bacterium]|nr:aminomethyl-transferring glycine dehydrogenase subunit GcvPB [Candidatus Sericytochromatia bacterium]